MSPNAWLSEFSGPVTATASAISALVLSEQHGGVLGDASDLSDIDSAYQGDLSEMLIGSIHWLARRQHSDGGWSGEVTDHSRPSELIPSMIVRATFQLTGAPAAYPDLSNRLAAFIKQRGGVDWLKHQYGPLHNATLLVRGCSALAEVEDWKQLPAVPLERATFGATSSRVEFWANRQPVLPALVALGIAGYQLHKPFNPVTSWRRMRACRRALDWLAQSQAADGGFNDSVPVTSMVLMSLASVGLTSAPIVRRGVEYLFGQVCRDGSWPGSQQHIGEFERELAGVAVS